MSTMTPKMYGDLARERSRDTGQRLDAARRERDAAHERTVATSHAAKLADEARASA